MEKVGYIYKITSPTGRIYIGKTTRLKDRITYYRNNYRSGQKMIESSIGKYGWENHIFEIIAESTVDHLNELEIKYIKEYNSFHYDNPNGMNLTRGGEGLLGKKHTQSTINLMVAKRTGSKRSESTKKLMSDLKKGKIPSGASYTRTEKHIETLRQNRLGKKISEEETLKRKKTLLDKYLKVHGAILQIDVVTEEIVKEWNTSPKYIAEYLNVHPSNIIRCLSKHLKTGVGYIWKYKHEINPQS
jgi:group I intron endonuclease